MRLVVTAACHVSKAALMRLVQDSCLLSRRNVVVHILYVKAVPLTRLVTGTPATRLSSGIAWSDTQAYASRAENTQVSSAVGVRRPWMPVDELDAIDGVIS